MRRLIALPIVAIFSLALATFGFTLGASVPARAFGTHHAFCLTGDEWPGLSNCTFDSYAQCQASSSGRALTCIANPYFAGQSDDPYAYQNRPRAEVPGYPVTTCRAEMRRAGLELLAIGLLLAGAPAHAQTYDPSYPVCMQIYGPVGYFDCRYTSLEQCRFLDVGRSATCVANPYFAQKKPPSPPKARQLNRDADMRPALH